MHLSTKGNINLKKLSEHPRVIKALACTDAPSQKK